MRYHQNQRKKIFCVVLARVSTLAIILVIKVKEPHCSKFNLTIMFVDINVLFVSGAPMKYLLILLI